jgi:uncharacterized membrane protein YfcA
MFAIDWVIALAGLAVGGVIGLTGMGGGALMTPLLVLVFGIPPTVAVGSDLAASLVVKPLGAFVHHRRGTVVKPLVRYLSIGSVPSAFVGAALNNHLGRSPEVQQALKGVLGVTLLFAAVAMIAKATLGARRAVPPGASDVPIALKPLRTIAIGVLGGFIVGMTSVGSGSIVVVMLMLLYPRLTGSRLVGTDLMQAIPLVGAATLGHLVFGHVHFDLTASLLAGSIPGVYLGARISARAADRFVRPAMVIVLVATAMKLLGATNAVAGAASLTLLGAFVTLAISRSPRVEKAREPEETAPAVETAQT